MEGSFKVSAAFLVCCGCVVAVPGGILMLMTHSGKDGEILPASCVCTSKPHHYTDVRAVPDGNGGTRIETSEECKVDVLAVTTSLSMINMTSHQTVHACSCCPGPSKCYINSHSREIHFSRWRAENAMESYMAGAVLVGLAGCSSLAACTGFLLQKAARARKARRRSNHHPATTTTTTTIAPLPAPPGSWQANTSPFYNSYGFAGTEYGSYRTPLGSPVHPMEPAESGHWRGDGEDVV